MNDALQAKRLSARFALLTRTRTLASLEVSDEFMSISGALEILIEELTDTDDLADWAEAERVIEIALAHLLAYVHELADAYPQAVAKMRDAYDLAMSLIDSLWPADRPKPSTPERIRVFFDKAATDAAQIILCFLDNGIVPPVLTEAVYSPQTLNTFVQVETIVPCMKRDQLVKIFDPAAWAGRYKCSFRRTDRVIEDSDGHLRKDTSQPSSLAPWQGLLFEDFVFPWHSFNLARFTNLLNINFRVAPDGGKREDELASVKFSLKRALGSSVGGTRRIGGMQRNTGEQVARRLNADDSKRPFGLPPESWRELWKALSEKSEGDFMHVISTKTVRFTNALPKMLTRSPWQAGNYMNFLAPAMLGSWMQLGMEAWVRPKSRS